MGNAGRAIRRLSRSIETDALQADRRRRLRICHERLGGRHQSDGLCLQLPLSDTRLARVGRRLLAGLVAGDIELRHGLSRSTRRSDAHKRYQSLPSIALGDGLRADVGNLVRGRDVARLDLWPPEDLVAPVEVDSVRTSDMSKFGASTLCKDLYDGLVVLGDEKLHLRIVTSPLEEALDRVESMRAKV